MHALAYSPSGDRIATGGYATICIWNAKTGQLVIRPINDLGDFVSSLVWSSDSTKLYSASDKFARVFDSSTGTLLYHFQHSVHLFSVALSPQNDILACVGIEGIVQLWDIVSCQPLALPFGQVQDRATLYCVSFSRDGTYLAYSGENKLTLWMVEDMALRLAAPVHSHRQTIQQETRSESLSSSCLDADATGGDDIIEEAHDDPYDTFFQSSQPSLSSALSVPPRLHPARRFWNTISLHHPPENKSVPLQDRLKRKFFAYRARSHSPQPANTTPKQPTPDGAGRAEAEDKDSAQTPLPNDSSCELDDKQNSKLWRLLQARAKDSASADEAPAKKRKPSPKVVEVYAVRGFQGYVALTRKRKAKSLAATFAPATAAHPAQAGSSSQGMAGHGTQYLHATGGPLPQASPSHFVTSHNSDSRSSIEGSCNRFLDKICFPCGHFHDDS
ncbi:WD40-repeat-containing domain protein [Suillus paluster]|uniref:WD40-repeat-containing domain protein n=1 Tax=Suillus paluster TaxID=48578 RepID=UPI001B8773FC|nr:WD40-repeat-containing domain protein [Suillus paluster]KAG1742257.1 WD40-repeat-containing domain protein [Suillus paluster]